MKNNETIVLGDYVLIVSGQDKGITGEVVGIGKTGNTIHVHIAGQWSYNLVIAEAKVKKLLPNKHPEFFI